MIEQAIQLLGETRPALVKAIDNTPLDQLLTVPEGFRNNILWNIGHIVVSQQGLNYRLSGLEQYVTEEQREQFRRGSDPSSWSEVPDVGLLRSQLTELPERLLADYRSGRFTDFQEFRTTTGHTLRNIGDAIIFNHFHEGYHAGIISAQRRLVSGG